MRSANTLRRFATHASGLASGLALAVRPAGSAEVSGVKGWGPRRSAPPGRRDRLEGLLDPLYQRKFALLISAARGASRIMGHHGGCCSAELAEVMRESLNAAANEQPPSGGQAQCDEHDEQGEVPEPGPAFIVVDGVSGQPADGDDRRRDCGPYPGVQDGLSLRVSPPDAGSLATQP
jgi:hypothetical protein